MNKLIPLASLLTLSILLSGCAIQRANLAATAKASMIGMPKQKVLQCMGAANAVQKQGNTEVWQYSSGGDYHSSINIYTNNEYSYGSMSSRKKYCIVNVIFMKDKVSNVIYSGRTGGLFSQGEQCSYAVNNCIR